MTTQEVGQDWATNEPIMECEECGREIPNEEGGSLANRHHAPSCSLYDPKAH